MEREQIARAANENFGTPRLSPTSTKNVLFAWLEKNSDVQEWDRSHEGGYTVDGLWAEVWSVVEATEPPRAGFPVKHTTRTHLRPFPRSRVNAPIGRAPVEFEDLQRDAESLAAESIGAPVRNVTFDHTPDFDDVVIRFEYLGRDSVWRKESLPTALRWPWFFRAVRQFDGYEKSSKGVRENSRLNLVGWSIGYHDEISAHAAIRDLSPKHGRKRMLVMTQDDREPRDPNEPVDLGLYELVDGETWELVNYESFDTPATAAQAARSDSVWS